jgi:AcrR family transcriptional regulator
MATKTRAYSSTRRQAQAAQTRTDVLQAAVTLFSERGWKGTTLAAIAERAGVAIETVYSGFGSKKALLLAAVDVAVVGDAEPIPLFDRPEARDLAKGPRVERIRKGVALNAQVAERVGPMWRAALEAAAGDADIAKWIDEKERARRLDDGRALELIFDRPPTDEELDLIWVLYGNEVYLKLHDTGWSRAKYEEHLFTLTKRIFGVR